MTVENGTCREPDALTLYIEIDVARYRVSDKGTKYQVTESRLDLDTRERVTASAFD